jgi:hypothetical protein
MGCDKIGDHLRRAYQYLESSDVTVTNEIQDRPHLLKSVLDQSTYFHKELGIVTVHLDLYPPVIAKRQSARILFIAVVRAAVGFLILCASSMIMILQEGDINGGLRATA